MRRIVRMVAAGIVIILGLALVSAAAFSSDIVEATLPEAPTSGSGGGAIKPLNPNADNGPVRKVDDLEAPDIFGTEFGRRGEHEVSISMGGQGYYQVYWRGGKVEKGAGNYTRTKTVKGGFPLTLIIVNGLGRSVSCKVTIDGVEKDSKSSSAKEPIIFCSG